MIELAVPTAISSVFEGWPGLRQGQKGRYSNTIRFVSEASLISGGEPPEGVMKYLIKLYVTGQTPRSQQAIANLRRICEDELKGRYELVLIDILERPQLAEDEKILATPTVVKELPHPIRRDHRRPVRFGAGAPWLGS